MRITTLILMMTGWLACGFGSQTLALTVMSDSQMSDVSGAGVALGLANFRFALAPTSYIELTGTNTNIPAGWSRGDARYYGLTFSADDTLTGLTGTGVDWYGSACNNVNGNGLGCPMSSSGIQYFSPVFDPYVLRAFQEPGYDYQGVMQYPTVLELDGPRNPDTWKWAFWGEIEVGRNVAAAAGLQTFNYSAGTSGFYGSAAATTESCTSGGNTKYCALQSEVIIRGKPVTLDGNPSVMYLVKTLNNADPTLGYIYQSHLSGDFRFSVNQTNTNDALHAVPDFSSYEGLYFKNVDAYMPLGELNYQTLTVNDTAAHDGNFSLELTRLPNVNAPACGSTNSCTTTASYNNATNYNGFYQTGSLGSGYICWGSSVGGGSCATSNGLTQAQLDGAGALGTETGTVTGAVLANTAANSTSNGIFYENPTGTTITNLGTGMILGMRLQHLQVTSCGAGATPAC